jgi:hypothetical protein
VGGRGWGGGGEDKKRAGWGREREELTDDNLRPAKLFCSGASGGDGLAGWRFSRRAGRDEALLHETAKLAVAQGGEWN